MDYIVRVATSDDYRYAIEITEAMALSAAKRGVNITRRTPEYAIEKMAKGLAVIAVNTANDEWIGFCCTEVWTHEQFVANTGLIVSQKYRGLGVSRDIKFKLFELCREKFPQAKHFSLTTSAAVMHVNLELGYKVIPYSELTTDPLFLNGSDGWVDYVDLMKHPHGSSPHIAMVFDPARQQEDSVCMDIDAAIILEKVSLGTAV